MKILYLFIMLSSLVFSISTDYVPKCIKYKESQKVIDADWSQATNLMKQFVDINGSNYENMLLKELSIPVKMKPDSQYLEESLQLHQEVLDKNISFLPSVPPIPMDEYKKRTLKEIKHGIYYSHYENLISGVNSYIPYLYIRYLESKYEYGKSFTLYKAIAQKLLETYQIQEPSFINIMIQNNLLDIYTTALKHSIEVHSYTQKRKKELYTILSQFIANKTLFQNMLKEEKRIIIENIRMVYLESENIEEIIQQERILTKLIAIIDKDTLYSHLSHKKTLKKFIAQYQEKLNNIHTKILYFKTYQEYSAYDKKMSDLENMFSYSDLGRLYFLYLLDTLQWNSLAAKFKYTLNKKEFIEKGSSFLIRYSKAWIWGKYKFEFEERYQKNKALLKLLEQ